MQSGSETEEQIKLMKARESQQQYFHENDHVDKFSIEVTREGRFQVHKPGTKIRDMKADVHGGLLYTAGEDRRICIVDVKEKRLVPGGMLKTSNSRIKCIALDPGSKRLYASSLEGLFFIFNVSLPPTTAPLQPCISLVHTVPFQSHLYATDMQIDTNKNLIFCLLQSTHELFPSQIACI